MTHCFYICWVSLNREVSLSDKEPKYIHVLEKDIERLRTETNQEMEELRNRIESTFELFYTMFSAFADFVTSTTPKTKATVIAEYRFVRKLYHGLTELSPEEKIKAKLTTSFKDVITNVLRRASAIPFDEMIDILLRGLGIELTRKFVSPHLIAEVWGVRALEKFKEVIAN